MADFYREYAAAVNIGEKVFVVEQKTRTYNFFLDMDYKDHDELSVSDVKTLSQIICDKVRLLTNQQTALISVAEPKKKDDKIKSGACVRFFEEEPTRVTSPKQVSTSTGQDSSLIRMGQCS